jgi:hypothetical protein
MSKLTKAQLAELTPHIVNLTAGRLSASGFVQTSEAGVDAIFDTHLPTWAAARQGSPLRVVFYAHGGLVSEMEGLVAARKRIAWWKANGVYPIYFIWETGLAETLRNVMLRRERLARDIWDGTLDMVTERLARMGGGVGVWSAIKNSAAAASHPGNGGAWRVAQRLAAFRKHNLEVHAVGHSAGAIFHSHFVPAALDAGLASFRTVQFLAPALSVGNFNRSIRPLLGRGIDRLTVYNLSRDLERADHLSKLYHKSLLYLVSHALEPKFNVPLLGLEECLRADLRLAATLGLAGTPAPHAEAVFAPCDQCEATTHGGFDDDAATMDSVLLRVSGQVAPGLRTPLAA